MHLRSTTVRILFVAIACAGLGACRTRDYTGTRQAGEQPVAKPAQRIVIPPPPAKHQGPVEGAWYIPRAKWSVQPIAMSNITPMGRKPYRITIHHSSDIALPNGMQESGDPVKVLQYIERTHMLGIGKNEPFACIGYHYIISADGCVWEGRPLKFQGAHSTGDNNIGNIGLCLLGNFERHAVPAPQRAALISTLDRLVKTHGIAKSRETIVGHKHFKATDCPGRHLDPIVRAYADGGR
ncbi:MAG: N-acetylmuramoyl-L-alanine amidase [Planctomycetes bacterium]|nr:N-acetylmuramoyl-L-alanine amidase [Planctomycetota bacterium]